MALNGVANYNNTTCTVINQDYNGARKTAGERVIMGKQFNLFAS
jgi:hypothetical protein